MSKIQLLKEPGYLYDLCFVFYLKFNTQMYIDNLPNGSQKEQDIERAKELLTRFDEIPDDLYVFFHAIETGRIFLTTHYFSPYKNQFATTYNFKLLLEELSDRDKLVRNLIKYYFYDLDDGAVEQCAASLPRVFSCIKNSDYSDKVKNKLYEFFIDPDRYIQLLRYELIQKESVLSAYYKDHYQKIIDLYNQTSFESLHTQLREHTNINLDGDAEICYVSFCLLNKYLVSVWFLENAFLPLLGCEYTTILGQLKESSQDVDLCSFGTAVCEESRVKILNFILERGEVTCKDLEREFSFSGSTAYHHIILMTKAGLLKTRNEGKTILYSLNRQYVASVIHLLNKFAK